MIDGDPGWAAGRDRELGSSPAVRTDPTEGERAGQGEGRVPPPPAGQERMSERAPIAVNGRTYRWPDRPLVVVCVDGCEPDYVARAVDDGAMPSLAGMLRTGTSRVVDAVMPTFTNPNNLSIVTGAPPAVHGICGNYFYDRDADAEVMMNDPKYLRAETILAAFAGAGARLAVVTAKDKLRRLLGHGMTGICFSSEKADQTTVAEHGIADALGAGRPAPPLRV